MRSDLIGFVLTILLIAFACNKDRQDCSEVTITNAAPGCGGWGIVVDSKKYPSKNIPDQFKQNGLNVCATYELYEDKAMCICCGGTWATILSMKKND